jgi:hypothetical protein
MIIQREDGTIMMKFGTGDIGINVGKAEDGIILLLYNQEAQDIHFPEENDLRETKLCSLDDFPVSMYFTKIESIDVIIKSLQVAKGVMLGEIPFGTEGPDAEI